MKRTQLRAKSRKTAARDRRYARERERFLEDHPLCGAGWDERCTVRATEVHHEKGRLSSVFFDQSLWLAVCHHCHRQITERPIEAWARGLSVKRTA